MMRNKHTVETHIHWKVKSGSCSFWWDNWLGIGPLAHYFSNSNRFNIVTISDFMEGGNGTWRKSFNKLHKLMCTTFWQLSSSCNQASLINLLGASMLVVISRALLHGMSLGSIDQKPKFNTYNWHKSIPFKCSFLLWRAVRGKLPTNESLTRFAVGPSECYCCHTPGLDTIEHTFNSGIFANKVWKFFAISLGIQTDHLPLRYLIIRWWNSNYNNEAHKLIIQSTPIFICWNLWKNRCSKKYGGKQFNIARVKFAVFKDIIKLLHVVFPYISWPSSWKNLCILIEQCYHDTKVTLVQWIKPSDAWVKLNTDRSALSNPGKIGAGGILRDSNGKLLFTYSAPLGEGTNNQEEVEADTFGISWCVHINYHKVILEVDSQLLVDWLLAISAPSWNITSQMQKLPMLTTHISHFKCIHTLREANYVADALSKHSHQVTTPQVYFNNQQLPKEATTHLQLDMTGTTSFRRRKIKRIKKPP
ncbi:hypothetical protein KY284_032712 [Solanum tuberosum]|nr:hypothetical protein KY284_032712 [Solanum tuberosum]